MRKGQWNYAKIIPRYINMESLKHRQAAWIYLILGEAVYRKVNKWFVYRF